MQAPHSFVRHTRQSPRTRARPRPPNSQASRRRPCAAVRQRAAGEGTRTQGAAILVFPKVTKAGLGIGGQYGEGASEGRDRGAYYKTTGASFGLQAGGQQYGYAMFFMNAKALEQLDNANGFEVGVGPSVVLVDEGMAKTTTTTTLKDDIYAFVFGQKGLMAGLGIQGNKSPGSRPSS